MTKAAQLSITGFHCNRFAKWLKTHARKLQQTAILNCVRNLFEVYKSEWRDRTAAVILVTTPKTASLLNHHKVRGE